jgi:hypothetical protein
MPEALARCLQDTLFFAYEILYFRFAKLRQRRIDVIDDRSDNGSPEFALYF